MSLSQTEFETLLQQLQGEQTESSIIDGKQELHLATEGDRAYFVRHIAALANNVEPSYLIIGVENRTWNAIGIPPTSQLSDPDATQHQMNQVLRTRLDPSVMVRYRTYQVSGVTLGLVCIDGKSAPYVVAIEDQQYGGIRTRGADEYIYRGAVYIRHGANSIIANRQSQTIEIMQKAQDQAARQEEPDEFLVSNNYLNIDSEAFAKHELSETLAEVQKKPGPKWVNDYIPAQSWVSFVFLPLGGRCAIDTVSLKDTLQPDRRIGRNGQWFHGLPQPVTLMFFEARGTPRQFIAKWLPERKETNDMATHIYRVLPSGQIEFACTYPLFYERDGVRLFSFVNLIGHLWQLIYLSKAIYVDASCVDEIALLVNLIGTRDTYLADYAKSNRGGWLPFFDPMSSKLDHQQCQERNIQINKHINLYHTTDDEIEALIRAVAQELGAYYAQDQPRCFDYHTQEFPVRDYIERNRW